MRQVRRAGTDDLEVLVELESALFVEDAGRHDPFADVSWPEREGRADFERLLASEECVVLVAERDGSAVGLLVGYAAPSSPTRKPVTYAVLRSLYVVPELRRSGVARALIEAFLEWGRAKGCAEAHVDHYAANAGAAELYASLGFAPRSISQARPLDVEGAREG